MMKLWIEGGSIDLSSLDDKAVLVVDEKLPSSPTAHRRARFLLRFLDVRKDNPQRFEVTTHCDAPEFRQFLNGPPRPGKMILTLEEIIPPSPPVSAKKPKRKKAAALTAKKGKR